MFSGARLRRLRNERGLSQAALARTLNLSTSYVNHLENDQRPMPFEEVRDFFYDRNNYIGELDVAAERMFIQSGMTVGGLDVQLSALMHERFGVRVVVDADLPAHAKRSYDPETKVLRIAQWLLPGQRSFQIATQLALVSQPELLSAI